MSKHLIWYHNEDNDGVFSGAIIYNYLIHECKVSKDDIVLEGTKYADLAEKYPTNDSIIQLKETFDIVYMSDVSFNDVSKMKLLYTTFGDSFIWIDHHAPVIRESFRLKFDMCNGWRDTSRSAILNTYRYFYDPLDEEYNARKYDNDIIRFPELLRILSAYDSWSFKREKLKQDYVTNVNKGVTIYFNLDIQKVIEYIEHVLYGDLIHERAEMKSFIAKMSREGKGYNQYELQRAENQIKEYGDLSWSVNGRPTAMIMAQYPTSSLMFKSVADKVLNGLIFKRLPNGNWNISLYNTNDNDTFHCGKYLKEKYKGGGHAGAAGCTISEKEFIKMLKNKQL